MKNEALAVCRRRQRPIQPSFTPVFTPPPPAHGYYYYRSYSHRFQRG